MCRAMPFSARTLLALWMKNIFFDVDIVVGNKSICCLSWSVLSSTTSTRHNSFPKHFLYSFCMLSGEFAKVFERKVWRLQVANLHNAARALSSPCRCFQLSTNLDKDFCRYLWYCGKKTNRISFSMALVKFHRFGINWHVFVQKLRFVYYYSENRATSQIWKVLPNMVFPPIWREKMAAFWACACKLSLLDSLFARPGFSPYTGREERRVQGLDYSFLCLGHLHDL